MPTDEQGYSFLALVKHVLRSPSEGTHAALARPYPITTALLLMGLGWLVATLFAVAITSQMYVLSAKTLLFTAKVGTVGLFFVTVLGLLTYLFTQIFTRATPLTIIRVAGLASLGNMVLVVLLLVLLLVFRDSLIDTFANGPVAPTPPVVLLCLLVLYGLFYMLTTVQQALSVAGLSKSKQWFLPPLILTAAIYITYGVGGWWI